MGVEVGGEEDNDHKMVANDNIFFNLEVSSNSDENSEYSFLDEISTGLNFRESKRNVKVKEFQV